MKAKNLLYITPALLLFSSVVSCNNNSVTLTSITATCSVTTAKVGDTLKADSIVVKAVKSDKSEETIAYTYQKDNSYVASIDDKLINLTTGYTFESTNEYIFNIVYKTCFSSFKVTVS